MKSSLKPFFYGLILCVVLPLIHSKTLLFGMHVHRILFFWFIVEISLVYYVWSLRNTNQINPKKSIISISILVLLLSGILSTIFSVSPEISFFSNFERMNGMLTTIHFVLFYFIFGSITLQKKQWLSIAIVSVLVAIIISIWGIIESSRFSDGRVQSTLSNPLFLAIYLIFNIFIAFILIFKVRQSNLTGSKKIVFISLLLIAISILFYANIQSKSRSATLGLVLGLSLSLLILGFLEQKFRKIVLFSVLFLFGLVAFIFINKEKSYIYENPALGRITNFSFSESSINSRIKIWKMSLNGLKNDIPIVGYGKENFTYFYAEKYEPLLISKKDAAWYDRSHNFVIDKIVEEGLIGLFAYLFLFFCIIYQLWKKTTNLTNATKSLITGNVFAFLFYNFFVFDHFISLLYIFIIIVFIEQFNTESKKIELPNFDYKVPLLCLILIIPISYFLIFKSLATIKNWSKASATQDFGIMMDAYEKTFKNALIGRYDVGIEFALQKSRVDQSGLDQPSKNAFYTASEGILSDLLKSMPNQPIIKSQYGFLQLGLNKKNEAIKTYEDLKKLAPKRQTNLMDLGIMYLENQEFDKAFKQFDEVYNLNNQYQTAMIYKAYAMAKKGESIESIKNIYKKIDLISVVENIELVYTTFQTKNDLDFLVNYFSGTKDKSPFTQKTYLYWLYAALETKNSIEIYYAIYLYHRHYNGTPSEEDKINLTKENLRKFAYGIEDKSIPVEQFTAYFDRFPGR